MRLLIPLLLSACATTTPAVRPAPSPRAAPPSVEAHPHGETETQILPGDSVGPVHGQTTYRELAARLGADSIGEATVDLGEGVTATATVLYADTPRELHVVWQDDDRTRVERVHVVGSAWELPEGLHRGDSLATMVETTGPVSFLGFGWDGAGTVVLTSTPLEKYSDALTLRLHPTGLVSDALMGDEAFAHDHPGVEAAALVLGEVRVRVN